MNGRNTAIHVAIDLDDVILDLCGGLQRSTTIEFGVTPPLAAFQDKDYVCEDGRRLWGPEMLGHYSDQESWLREKDWIWTTFPAVEGALGGLKALRDNGHVLEIVTAKPRWAEWVTWKWLGLWRPPVHSVTIVPLGANKAMWTRADVLIDDNLGNCNDFTQAGRASILFPRAWNVGEHGWKAIPTLVEMMAFNQASEMTT